MARLGTVIILICTVLGLPAFRQTAEVDWAGVALTPFPLTAKDLQLVEQHITIDMPHVRDRLLIRSDTDQTLQLYFPERNMCKAGKADQHTIKHLRASLSGKPIELKTIDGEAAPDEPGGDRWLHLIPVTLKKDTVHELLLEYSVESALDSAGNYIFEYLPDTSRNWSKSMQSFSVNVLIPGCSRVECEFPGIVIQRDCHTSRLSASLSGPPGQDLKIEYGLVKTDIELRGRKAESLWQEYGSFEAIPQQKREGYTKDAYIYQMLLPSFLMGSWTAPELLGLLSEPYLQRLLQTPKVLKGQACDDPFFKNQFWYCPGQGAVTVPQSSGLTRLLEDINREKSKRED